MIEAGRQPTSPNRRLGLRTLVELGSQAAATALSTDTRNTIPRIHRLDLREIGLTTSITVTKKNKLPGSGGIPGQTGLPGLLKLSSVETIKVRVKDLGAHANPNSHKDLAY